MNCNEFINSGLGLEKMMMSHIPLSLFCLSLLLWCCQTIPAGNVATAFWEPLPDKSLPSPIQSRIVFHDDGLSTQGEIYAIGGEVMGNFQPSDKVYHTLVGEVSWTERFPGGDTFSKRHLHATAVVSDGSKDYIVAYGGIEFRDFVEFCTSGTCFPFTAADFGVAALIFPMQDLAILDLEAQTWSSPGKTVDASFASIFTYQTKTCCSTCELVDCPSARTTSKALTFPQDPHLMYMYGGLNGTDALDEMWIFDITEPDERFRWSQEIITNQIPGGQPRIGGATVALPGTNKRMVTYSGFFLYNEPTDPPIRAIYVTNDVLVLEESGGMWTWSVALPAAPGFPQARSDPLHALVDTSLFMYGGNNSTGDDTLDAGKPTTLSTPVWVLDLAGNYTNWAWSVAETATAFSPGPLASDALVYIPTSKAIFAVGGGVDGIPTDKVLRFHAKALQPPVTISAPRLNQGYGLNLAKDWVAEFPETAPNVLLFNDTAQKEVAFVEFVRLVELDVNGAEVAGNELDLPPNDYVIGYEQATLNNEKFSSFSRVAENGLVWRLEFVQYGADGTYEPIPAESDQPLDPQPITAGNIKFTLVVANWPFQDFSDNTLQLEMRWVIGSDADQVIVDHTGDTIVFFNLDTSTNLMVNLLNYSINDAVRQNFLVNAGSKEPVLIDVNPIPGNPREFLMTFQFMPFTKLLNYDPDFGVFLSSSDGDGDGDGGNDGNDGGNDAGDSDGGSGDDNIGFIIGVTVGVFVAVILVISIVVIGLVVCKVKRARSRSKFKDRVGSAGIT